MQLWPLTACPFYNIPIITAFVNPFTSDAVVELTRPIQFHTELGISTVRGGQMFCQSTHR